MTDAIGFIETKGFVGAVAAADAMVKSADITLIGKEITGPGFVLIKISGDLASVKYAIEAGEIAAKNAGNFISSLVMSEPDSRLAAMLPELYTKIQTDNDNIAVNVQEHPEPESIITEQKTEVISEVETYIGENKAGVTDEPAEMQIEVTNDNPIDINKLEEELKVINDNLATDNTITGDNDGPDTQQVPVSQKVSEAEKKIKKINKRKKKAEGADIYKKEEEVIKPEAAEPVYDDEQISSIIYDAPDGGAPATVSDNLSSEYIPAIEDEENLNKSVTIKRGKKGKNKSQEVHATLFDSLFDSIEDSPVETSGKENVPVFSSTIERLKSEALGIPYENNSAAPVIIEDEVQEEPFDRITKNSLVKAVPEKEPSPVKEEGDHKEAVKEKKLSKKKKEQSNSDRMHKSNGSPENDISSDLSIDYLQTLNVHLLRKAARGISGFPIQGREISKANRQVLLDYFNQIL